MKCRCMVQVVGAGALVLVASGCAAPGMTYATPHEALDAVAGVAGTGDEARVEQIFGSDALNIIASGDAVADRADALRVKQMILDHVEFEGDEDEVIAIVGEERWAFPIPLTRHGDGWRFDLDAGREELLNRRVGRNELQTLVTLREYVIAQGEYAAVGRDGNPPAFAQAFRSTGGRHDGLYWPVMEGEPESPIGPLIADAVQEGYTRSADGPQAFHGYHYRILTSQGANAPGGERDYIDANGLMTVGFAVVAWPANQDNSGIMTFVVNHIGIIFEKDLGPTDDAARSITSFNPDETWAPVSD